jgi:hypothetical protein
MIRAAFCNVYIPYLFLYVEFLPHYFIWHFTSGTVHMKVIQNSSQLPRWLNCILPYCLPTVRKLQSCVASFLLISPSGIFLFKIRLQLKLRFLQIFVTTPWAADWPIARLLCTQCPGRDSNSRSQRS